MARTIVIGTRGSELALWQAYFIQGKLKELGQDAELKIIKTQGDKIQHLSFDKMEGKGFFTKEIEAHLLDESIDIAVHSHKDLETTMPEGLQIAAVSYRENPSDTLLIRSSRIDEEQLWKLPKNAVVGTSSARRKSQLLANRPDLTIKDLRGNVPTRIQKLKDGNYDAIVLAQAGISRINPDTSGLKKLQLDPKEFIPAPAQGVLAFQIRAGDKELETLLQKINDQAVHKRVAIERGILKALNGGCQLPFGAYCIENDSNVNLYVAYADSKNDPAFKLEYHAVKTDGLVEKVLSDLKKKRYSFPGR